MSAAEAVALTGLVKRYGGHPAVDGVTLALAPAERVALLGHNGAGKTTLMKMMLGVARPDAGQISVLGHDPRRAPLAVRRRIGFLPENVAFQDAMTGWQTMLFYARLKRRPNKECTALLERVGLSAAAGRRVGTYSKGMRQRLGLAQALLGDPSLLLLDEPTTGLDPELRLSFYEIVAALRRAGTTVLLSSHLLTELEERTDRVAIMDRGRLVTVGTLDELRERARLPVRFRLRMRPDDVPGVAERLAGSPGLVVDGEEIAFLCPAAEKMPVLRRVAAMAAVRDVEIAPPSLDEVYASFLGYHLDTRGAAA